MGPAPALRVSGRTREMNTPGAAGRSRDPAQSSRADPGRGAAQTRGQHACAARVARPRLWPRQVRSGQVCGRRRSVVAARACSLPAFAEGLMFELEVKMPQLAVAAPAGSAGGPGQAWSPAAGWGGGAGRWGTASPKENGGR